VFSAVAVSADIPTGLIEIFKKKNRQRSANVRDPLRAERMHARCRRKLLRKKRKRGKSSRPILNADSSWGRRYSLCVSMRTAFPWMMASATFLRAEARMRWNVLWEMPIRFALACCSSSSTSFKRSDSASSRLSPTSSRWRSGMPRGLKYDTLGSNRIQRGFRGLTIKDSAEHEPCGLKE